MPRQQSPQAGDIVLIRRQRWRVVSSRQYPACRVLALTGAATANAGRARHVISPFDDVVAASRGAIRLVSARAWRRRCRLLLASHGPADRLQTAWPARIELMAHQLEPALAIVRGRACRVLLADEVGLGKTIQAGLIASELKAREMADRILVLTPSGLREQWADELRRRFDLDAVVMDARSIRKRSTTVAIGVNPWTTVATAVASFDFVKRAEVLPALTSCRWDLVIVDEAHGCGPGSDRLAAVRAICGHASYVVLVTATPHSGSRPAFDALCGIGSRGDRLLIFRRARNAVALTAGRRVHRVLVEATRAEGALHAKLADIAAAVARDHESPRDAWLTVAVLQKRALSSAYAIGQTVARRLHAIEADPDDFDQQLPLPLAAAGELDPADDAPVGLSAVLRDAGAERKLLRSVAEHAAAAALRETKLACLQRLLRRLGRLCEQAIVFTEYRDTLLHVRRHLSCDCAVLHGGLTRDERRIELQRFAAGECRVLLATDAAGEGLNLHERCRVVINLELPWSPTRLEQRIGRVDRIGQRRRVHAFHLISRQSGELRLLDYLRAKLTRARLDISASDPLGCADLEHDDEVLARVAAGLDHIERSAPVVGQEPAEEAERAVFGHFEAEAAVELRRLHLARCCAAGEVPGGAVPDECLAVVARRTPTRIRLNGKLLAVVLAEVRDTYGRPVAMRLLPLLVAIARCHARGRLAGLTAAIEQEAARIDDGDWHRAATEIHEAFLGARRQRDAAILQHVERRWSTMVQPGLFDRRGLQAYEANAARVAGLKHDLERSLAIAPPPSHVVRAALLMAVRW